MKMSAVWILFFGTIVDFSACCLICFVDMNDIVRLCEMYYTQHHSQCVSLAEQIIDKNPNVIEAGRVGAGYDSRLKDILYAQMTPYLKALNGNLKDDAYYENLFQSIADNFTAEASKLPRAVGCFPPCGLQPYGGGYNCPNCQYDSCKYPVDCPTTELPVTENKRIEIRCDTAFSLPGDAVVVWRYAEEENQFSELIVGLDHLYTIPSARTYHQGTYQCEIFSEDSSIIRMSYHVTVTPQVVEGYDKLQQTFSMVLLPEGQTPPCAADAQSDHTLIHLPSPTLLTVCLTAMLLMLFLSLGFLYWWWFKRMEFSLDEDGAHSRQVRETVWLQ